MILQIIIDTCDDYDNTTGVYRHLERIKEEFAEREKKIIESLEIGNSFEFEDSNCYGFHKVIIKDLEDGKL